MGRKIGLTPERVLHAAAELADRDGFDGVTLAAVAGQLGVRSPSLYAHFDGLAALRRALCLHAATTLARTLQQARSGSRGREALAKVSHAYLGFVRRHPGWYTAVQSVTPDSPDGELYRALAEMVMPLVICLAEMGVPPGEMIHQTRVVRSALHGFASLEQSNGFGRPVDFDTSFSRLVDLITTGIAAPPATH